MQDRQEEKDDDNGDNYYVAIRDPEETPPQQSTTLTLFQQLTHAQSVLDEKLVARREVTSTFLRWIGGFCGLLYTGFSLYYLILLVLDACHSENPDNNDISMFVYCTSSAILSGIVWKKSYQPDSCLFQCCLRMHYWDHENDNLGPTPLLTPLEEKEIKSTIDAFHQFDATGEYKITASMQKRDYLLLSREIHHASTLEKPILDTQKTRGQALLTYVEKTMLFGQSPPPTVIKPIVEYMGINDHILHELLVENKYISPAPGRN